MDAQGRTPRAEGAFLQLKRICTYPDLWMPLANQPFIVYTAASNMELGAMLSQDMRWGEWPIFFLGQKLSKAKRNYTAIKKEALTIKWAVDSF